MQERTFVRGADAEITVEPNPLGDFIRTIATDRPLAEVAAEILREKILRGDFLPGTRMIEADLAKLYGVSRGTVREALRFLDREGLVETAKHRSPTVKGVDVTMFAQMFEVRSLLEGYASRLAVKRIYENPADVAWAEGQVIAWKSERYVQSVSEHIAQNRHFHQRLLQIAGHELLAAQINNLIMPGYRTVLEHRLSPDKMCASAQQHASVLEAILKGDESGAENLMRYHVDESGKVVVEAFSLAFLDPRLRELRRLTDA